MGPHTSTDGQDEVKPDLARAWQVGGLADRSLHSRVGAATCSVGTVTYLPESFVAWQSGNGALANVALDRALADDPQYSMALLLRQVITSGAPPWLARLPMTPEEVAASYAEEKDEAGNSPAAAAGPGPD